MVALAEFLISTDQEQSTKNKNLTRASSKRYKKNTPCGVNYKQ